MNQNPIGKTELPHAPKDRQQANNFLDILRRLDEAMALVQKALAVVPTDGGGGEDTGEDPGKTLPVLFAARFSPVVFTRYSVPSGELGGTAYTKDKVNKLVSAAVGETKVHRLESYSSLTATSVHISASGFGDVNLDPSTWTSTGDEGRLSASNGTPFKGTDAFGDPIWYIDVSVTNSATDRSASDAYCLELSFARTSAPGAIPAPGVASHSPKTTKFSPTNIPSTAVYNTNPGTGPL